MAISGGADAQAAARAAASGHRGLPSEASARAQAVAAAHQAAVDAGFHPAQAGKLSRREAQAVAEAAVAKFVAESQPGAPDNEQTRRAIAEQAAADALREGQPNSDATEANQRAFALEAASTTAANIGARVVVGEELTREQALEAVELTLLARAGETAKPKQSRREALAAVQRVLRERNRQEDVRP